MEDFNFQKEQERKDFYQLRLDKNTQIIQEKSERIKKMEELENQLLNRLKNSQTAQNEAIEKLKNSFSQT